MSTRSRPRARRAAVNAPAIATPTPAAEAVPEVNNAPAPAQPVAAPAVEPPPVASVGEKDKPGKKKKDSDKEKKDKLVRDSFTLPQADYALFAQLKARCLAQGIEAKKSELLRAALRQLAGLDDVVLAAVMSEIEKLKTGRPGK